MIIYGPKGKAREYSELACNLFTGCLHKCRYCYCPAIMHKTLEQWSSDPQPKKDIIKKLEKEAAKIAGCEKEILFCFMSDPYQSAEAAEITRQALLICEKYRLRVQVLTKAGLNATRDFDILKRNNWKFGSTIIFQSEKYRLIYEPGAPSIESRYEAVKKAHEMGIYTWVSVEPVIYPEQAIGVMSDLKPYVNFWKVGKLNHFEEIEAGIDWADFLQKTKQTLSGVDYYIKKDLAKYETIIS